MRGGLRTVIGLLLMLVPSAAAGQSSGVSQPAQQDPAQLPSFIPPVTEEDRRIAFPDVHGHTIHDNAIHSFLLADQFEWQRGGGTNAYLWDAKGWVGRDTDRLWFRTEGEGHGDSLEGAEAHVLYGRAVGRWWDLVAGVRQDMRPGPGRTWAAIGFQGLAPYWFEVEGTAYVAAGGRTHLRLETEYELLVTNRLIVQPLIEVNLYGKADPERGIGAGLSTVETGFRFRYEAKREFAPYLGVSWDHRVFATADVARAAGRPVRDTRLVIGARVWR